MSFRDAAADASVSAIVPVHNGARFLAEALESIACQTHPPLETIVVDDGSTDDTPAVLDRYAGSIRVIRQEQHGAAAARNVAVRLAQGRILAFLDADDRWEPDKTRRQLALLRNEPATEAVFGLARKFWESGAGPQVEKVPARRSSTDLRGFLLGTLLIRADSFRRVGPLDESFEVGEFIDWFSRAQHSGLRWRMLEEVVLHRRIHDSNQGIRKRLLYRREYARALRLHLRRKPSDDDRKK